MPPYSSFVPKRKRSGSLSGSYAATCRHRHRQEKRAQGLWRSSQPGKVWFDTTPTLTVPWEDRCWVRIVARNTALGCMYAGVPSVCMASCEIKAQVMEIAHLESGSRAGGGAGHGNDGDHGHARGAVLQRGLQPHGSLHTEAALGVVVQLQTQVVLATALVIHQGHASRSRTAAALVHAVTAGEVRDVRRIRVHVIEVRERRLADEEVTEGAPDSVDKGSLVDIEDFELDICTRSELVSKEHTIHLIPRGAFARVCPPGVVGVFPALCQLGRVVDTAYHNIASEGAAHTRWDKGVSFAEGVEGCEKSKRMQSEEKGALCEQKMRTHSGGRDADFAPALRSSRNLEQATKKAAVDIWCCSPGTLDDFVDSIILFQAWELDEKLLPADPVGVRVAGTLIEPGCKVHATCVCDQNGTCFDPLYIRWALVACRGGRERGATNVRGIDIAVRFLGTVPDGARLHAAQLFPLQAQIAQPSDKLSSRLRFCLFDS
eukprot:304234-Prorocentrum_minimum.AAC.5